MTEPYVNDTPPHQKFEQQVERIHQLLDAEGATVTWNDRIPDPDNPSQPRQIDISIRRDGMLTLVECRIHKNPQDVTWIEELMGRRTSLKADAVIAVSASGFTKTARDKAVAHGIHLRELAALSPEEIKNWGHTRTVTLNFCEFTQVKVVIRASQLTRPGLPQLTGPDGKPPSPLIWQLLYQSVMQGLHADGWNGVPNTIDVPVEAKLLVNGKPPNSIVFHAKVRRVSQRVALASVFEYADAVTATSHAQVGSYQLGASEMIEGSDNVDMVIDLSTISVPDNCCFETVTVDAGRIVNARPRVIGAEQAMSCRIPIELRYEFPAR